MQNIYTVESIAGQSVKKEKEMPLDNKKSAKTVKIDQKDQTNIFISKCWNSQNICKCKLNV